MLGNHHLLGHLHRKTPLTHDLGRPVSGVVVQGCRLFSTFPIRVKQETMLGSKP